MYPYSFGIVFDIYVKCGGVCFKVKSAVERGKRVLAISLVVAHIKLGLWDR